MEMDTIKIGPLTFSVWGITVSVTSCDKEAIEVTIPKKVNDMIVVSIDDYAFEECEKLTHVYFEEYTEDDYVNYFDVFNEVGAYTFSHCSSLKKVVFPNVPYITMGRGAFYKCKSLESINYPSGSFAGPYAFSDCESLKDAPSISYVSDGVFLDCKSLTYLPISANVTEISDDAFEGCTGLVDIVIPANVKTIGPLAFRGCSGLKTVTFQNPNDWYYTVVYTQKEEKVNFKDKEKAAKILSGVDFDDGISSWYRK